MVQVGDQPIIRYILEHYAHYGHTEFVVALGYRGEQIRDYLLDLQDRSRRGLEPADLTAGCSTSSTPGSSPTPVAAGRLRPYLADDTFMLTYGDGIADVDLARLLAFHRGHGRLASVTAVHPPPRFGQLHLDGDAVRGSTRSR
jgi:glucose-1-phosphate cytidylyltransferase